MLAGAATILHSGMRMLRVVVTVVTAVALPMVHIDTHESSARKSAGDVAVGSGT